MLFPPATPPASTSVPVTGKARQAGPRSRRKTAAVLACTYRNCAKAFRWPSHLKRHLSIHTGEKLLGCPHEGCASSFAQPGTLSNHLRSVHSTQRPFVCPQENCRYAFAIAGNLKKHLRVHSGEKPFVCSHKGCGQAFTRSTHLTIHRRRHTGEKPFACSYEGCGQAFAQSNALRYHLRAAHTGEKPFVCPYEGCAYAFIQSSHRQQHLHVHSGAKPFACSYEGCRRWFAHPGARKIHKRRHTGEKLFLCPHEGCRYSSPQSGNLAAHLRTHSRKKNCAAPHEDGLKRFTQSNQRTRHLRTPRTQKHHARVLDGREKRLRGKRNRTSFTGSHNTESAYRSNRPHSGAPGCPPDRLTTHRHAHGVTRPPGGHYPECHRSCLPLRAPRMHQPRHTGQTADIGSDENSGQGFVQQRSLQPQVSFSSIEQHCRHASAPSGHRPWEAAGLRQARGGVLSSSADINPPLIKSGQQDSLVRTHTRCNTTIARKPGSRQPHRHYCSVIAWVYGGIVYTTPQPGQPLAVARERPPL